MISRRAAGLVVLFLAARAGFSEQPISSSSGRPAPEMIRGWLVRQPGASPSEKPESVSGDPELAAWADYLEISSRKPGRDYEEKLRKILDGPISDSLRHVIQLDLQSDLSFQSRQAQFIRRYGFWSNWFNRTTYVGSRMLQGNIQSAGQLVVDGVFDIFRRGEATPAERRAYKLLQDLKEAGRATRAEKEKIASLRAKVEDALAEVELEKARWAFKQGSPGLAAFYAQGALDRKPNWKKGIQELGRAERESAARRREAVASSQAGYPDHQPPLHWNAPAKLREADSVSSASERKPRPVSDPKNPNEAYLAWLIGTLDPSDRDYVKTLRSWAEARNASSSPLEATRWTARMLGDPRFNPEVRLARAQSDRRAGLARFIFLGPQSASERAYTASSRGVQMWNALSSVGVFYVFEIVYRAGIAAFSPPSPEDEVYDAEVIFLRSSPGNPGAARIARRLADQYVKAARYDDAREMLTQFGLLSESERGRITKAESRWLLSRGSELPRDDPRRKKMLEKVIELTPESRAAKSARKELDKKPKREEKIEVHVRWNVFKDWLHQPLPAGLPLREEWFDGNPDNGEREGEEFSIEAEGEKAEQLALNFKVRDAKGAKLIAKNLKLDDLPPEIARWLRTQISEGARREREEGRLGRLSFPYELTGGAGLSGVDFYPRLLPIESRPGETRLYQDAP